MIGRAFGQHVGQHFAITLHALHLVERAFIMLQAQPVHAIQNCLHGFRRGAFKISIFNTQHKGATKVTGKSPAEQGSAGTANMKIAGRAGSKTGAYSHEITSVYPAANRTQADKTL